MKGKLLFVLILCSSAMLYGQTGNDFYNPVQVGAYNSTGTFTDTKDTNNFGNCYAGKPTNDVYYGFTLLKKMTVTVSHCGSQIEDDDTIMYLTGQSGNLIATNDEYYGHGCHPELACIKITLSPGTYYIISEGFSKNGIIKTSFVFEEI